MNSTGIIGLCVWAIPIVAFFWYCAATDQDPRGIYLPKYVPWELGHLSVIQFLPIWPLFLLTLMTVGVLYVLLYGPLWWLPKTLAHSYRDIMKKRYKPVNIPKAKVVKGEQHG